MPAAPRAVVRQSLEDFKSTRYDELLRRTGTALFLTPEINQFEGILAVACELERYIDTVRFEKSFVDITNSWVRAYRKIPKRKGLRMQMRKTIWAVTLGVGLPIEFVLSAREGIQNPSR
jgi:hypothetical protein